MKINETRDRIILRDAPFGFWVAGFFGFLLFGGCFVWMIVYAVFNPREVFSSEGGGPAGFVSAVAVFVLFLGFLGALAAAFTGFILSPVIRTTIDRREKTVEISRRGLFKSRVKRYDLSQIKCFDLEERPTSRFGPVFYVVLTLKNDLRIELVTDGRSAVEAEKIAARLNSFFDEAKGRTGQG